jgi:hypothetical protein
VERIVIGYWDTPDQVIWVWVGNHRLQGMDNYWVDWPRYGMFNDPVNIDWYPGRQEVAWEWTPDGEIEIDPTPPDGVTIHRGFMLTTEQAEFVGLL